MKKIGFLTNVFLCLSMGYSFAEKITIVYTGQTHAALYHCACPKEPDGGVARRMTKLRQLRLENPNILLVEAGSFFAGGAYDEHSQGIELDKLRTELNQKTLELMAYDALAISDSELNFGKSYLEERIAQSSLPFLSANVKVLGARPYLLKAIGNIHIAVIGLTNDEAKVKSGGLVMEDALLALERTVREVKEKKVDIVVVVSSLGEEKDRQLLTQVKGIDIIISGNPVNSPEEYTKVGASYLVRPVWQGRRLSKMDIELEDSKIKDVKLTQIRLSDQVPEDQEIMKIVPQCFADSDCRKNAVNGRCGNPATLKASCSYEKPKPIPLLIIQPKNYQVPHQEKVVSSLKSIFPGLETRIIDSDSSLGKSLITQTQALLLPVYLLAKAVEGESAFSRIKEHAELKGEYYYVKPQFSGGSIFVGRQRIFKKLDVFMGTRGDYLSGVIAVLKELQEKYRDIEVNVHFLAIEAKNGFGTPSGLAELEEDLRQVCLKQYSPKKYWDYALCRAQRQESSWWDACAQAHGIDSAAIKKCAMSQEGVNFLRENIKLNSDLQIAGPTFLVNNYEVFAINGAPRIEQVEKMLGLKEVKK